MLRVIFRTYDFVTNKTIENVKNNISYFSNYKNHPFLVLQVEKIKVVIRYT